MIVERCRSNVKTIGQRAYVDFENRGAGNGGLQDELAGGVVEGDSLDVAVGVDNVQLVGDGVGVDAEGQRFVVADADVGRVGFVEIGDAVAEIRVGVVVEVAALADDLHDFRRSVAGHGLPKAGAETGNDGT